jgi:uncharacterized protein with HEPN domain
MQHDSLNADLVRIKHMIGAAREAMAFAEGRGRTDLESDAMFRRAVVNCLQEIGEAGGQVSAATQVGMPNVPWIQINRMRHRLVHGYFAINLDLVWDVLASDLAPLIPQLEAFVKANS